MSQTEVHASAMVRLIWWARTERLHINRDESLSLRYHNVNEALCRPVRRGLL